jgi:uncharacterized protein with GYD domain
MATFILLANFTDQGIRNVKDSPKRVDAFKEMAQKAGVTIKDFYWTLGSHDMVVIAEALDELAVTALGLSVGAQGNVRTETLRAFNRAEMAQILAKMG